MNFYVSFLLFFMIIASGFSQSKDISNIASTLYNKTTGCFLLYDVTNDQEIAFYNREKSKIRMAPDSTFKIALSLMAFDSKIINQDTKFSWDKVDRGLSLWNQDQTPQTWIRNSVVWVSQAITPKLGLDRIQRYLVSFDYGNKDFSGNPQRNDGLTNAWLESSLKISPAEQVVFLKKLILRNLEVTKSAIQSTLDNMFLMESDKGTKIYGKTGAGFSSDRSLQNGWFEGFAVTKEGHKYIFVSALTGALGNKLVSSLKAKEIAFTLVNQLVN